MSRRFPPPWSIKDNGSAFYVEDAAGHQFGFCYYKSGDLDPANPVRMSPDEARRLVSNFAKLPELLAKPKSDGVLRDEQGFFAENAKKSSDP